MKKQQLIIWFCCLLFLLVSCQRKPKSCVLFPKTLTNLTLNKLVTGEQALEMVNKLHGKIIKAKRAWVAYYRGAFYQGNWHEATIWVSEASDANQAKQQVSIMMAKIKKDKTPFYHLSQKKVGSTLVYVFYGLGQEHAVFCKKQFVFWISASFEVFDNVLNFYLNAPLPKT